MNLTEAYLLLAVMLAVVAVVSVLFKGKSGLIAPLIFVAGLITALVAGLGFRLREVTEGPFVFVDTLMWVLCGAAFSYLLSVNGTFQFLFAKVVGKKRSPAAQMFILILFIGLPGMITGTALASVATTGLMAGRYLLDKGMEKSKEVEVVTVGALMGKLLPPLCVPAMAPTIARQGLYPGAFEGYFLPILILALPALIVYCALAGRRVLGEWEADGNVEKTGSAVCLIPLAVVAVLVLCYNFLYFLIPYYGGYPVIYLIGFVLALIFKCKGANPLIAAADGIRTVAVELALILAYASVVETFNLVGVNGTLSAQMEIAGINGAVIALVLGLLVLAGGLLLGTPFAYVVGALATYLVSNSNYGSYELSMMAVGAAIAMSMLLALRGSLAETVGETLGVTGVTGTEVVKRNIIFTLVLTAAIVVFLVAGSSLKFLMI